MYSQSPSCEAALAEISKRASRTANTARYTPVLPVPALFPTSGQRSASAVRCSTPPDALVGWLPASCLRSSQTDETDGAARRSAGLEGAHLDWALAGGGRFTGPLASGCIVGCLDHPETADLLLRLGEGAVGQGHLAVGEAGHAGGRGRHQTDGDVLTTDGPFAESKEHLGGFYIIEAEDLDAALAWASKATAAVGRPIEVWPFAATEA